jgi:hypothetical protein
MQRIDRLIGKLAFVVVTVNGIIPPGPRHVLCPPFQGGFCGGCRCSGNAALIQSTYGGQRNNFEVVVPNDQVSVYQGYAAAVNAVSLIESSSGNLEVVEWIGTSLAHFYRNSSGIWIEANHSITGNLATPGDFEVAVPLAIGGMALFTRDNSVLSHPWKFVDTFGSGNLASAAMIYRGYGNLEVVSHGGNGDCSLEHYWRNPPPAGQWPGPTVIRHWVLNRFGEDRRGADACPTSRPTPD